MNKVGKPAEFSDLMVSQGATKLRPEHGDPFLKPDRGVVFWSKFDNGGQLLVGVKDTGGCKLASQEASRSDVEKMIIGEYASVVRARLFGTETDGQLIQTTYAVVFRGTRMFVQVFGPKKENAGASVEVWPAEPPPPMIKPGAKISWPE